jgi:hypothetical protein
MSELEKIIKLFGFSNIDDITPDSLKKALKTRIIKAHPDRGGDAKEFDDLLSSYVYLTEIVKRVSGGRDNLENIVSPDELKELRPDEIINRFFEEFYNEEFNKYFEDNSNEYKKDERNYTDWLKNTDEDTNLTQGIYGSATQKAPTFAFEDLHTVFKETAKNGKPPPSTIILHPEAMAHVSALTVGNDIIENEDKSYTSDLYSKLEYTDAFEAFTKNNTICDKVSDFIETNIDIDTKLDNIIKQRMINIEPIRNSNHSLIRDFEDKKLNDTLKHQIKVKDYYTQIVCLKKVIDNRMAEEEKSFIFNF